MAIICSKWRLSVANRGQNGVFRLT